MKDPSIHFYLLKGAEGSSTEDRNVYRVIMSLCYSGKRMIYYTGMQAGIAEWDRETESYREFGDRGIDRNQYLRQLKETARVVYHSVAYKDVIPSPADLRKQLKAYRIMPGRDFFMEYLSFMERNSANWSSTSYLKCKSLYTHLSQFRSSYPVKICFASVNAHFMSAFCRYLSDKGLSPTSIKGYLGVLKWFLNDAYKQRFLFSDEFKTFRYYLPDIENEAQGFWLNDSELATLSSLNDLHPRLERCRDAFLFMCYSGLSAGEFFRLRKSELNDEFIQFNGLKKRTIPHNKITLEIYKKYRDKYYLKDNFIKIFSIQSLNINLRVLATLANLDRKITVRRRGRLMNGSVCELITAGVARQTFIALSLRKGLNPVVAAKWSARKSLAPWLNDPGSMGNLEIRETGKII